MALHVTPESTATLLLLVAVAVTAVAVAVVGRTYLRNRPNARTSARDRLLARNPALANGGTVRWSVAARRVRIGAPTALVVAVAVLVATARPRVVAGPDDGRRTAL